MGKRATFLTLDVRRLKYLQSQGWHFARAKGFCPGRWAKLGFSRFYPGFLPGKSGQNRAKLYNFLLDRLSSVWSRGKIAGSQHGDSGFEAERTQSVWHA